MGYEVWVYTRLILVMFCTPLCRHHPQRRSDEQKLTKKLLTNSLTTFLKLDISLTNWKKLS